MLMRVLKLIALMCNIIEPYHHQSVKDEKGTAEAGGLKGATERIK